MADERFPTPAPATAPTSDRAQTARMHIETLFYISTRATKQQSAAFIEAVETLLTERLWDAQRNTAAIDRLYHVCRALDEFLTTAWRDPKLPFEEAPAIAIRTLAQTARDATARAQNAEATVKRLEREVKAAHDYVRAACERLSVRKDLHANDGEMLLVAIDEAIGDNARLRAQGDARVVGACVDAGKYLMVSTANDYQSQEMCEAKAKHDARFFNAKAYKLCLGEELPLTKNADGGQ